MVLRKVCLKQDSSIQSVYDDVTQSYIRVPSDPAHCLIFELIEKKHTKDFEILIDGFLPMPLSYFGGNKDSELCDGESALSFEIPNMKRNARLIWFPVRFSAACTVLNAQGYTFEAVGIAKMRSHGSQLESRYVAILRAKFLNTLFLLENMSDEDIANFSKGPSQDFEMKWRRYTN